MNNIIILMKHFKNNKKTKTTNIIIFFGFCEWLQIYRQRLPNPSFWQSFFSIDKITILASRPKPSPKPLVCKFVSHVDFNLL